MPSLEAASYTAVKLNPRIHEIIDRVATREGLELVHAEMVGSNKNATLRIYIDKPEGVTLEDCALVSEQVGLILDVEDLIQNEYVLEVASPGLDRGLYKPSDYERFAGLPAHIKLTAPLNGQRNFHGTLIGLEQEGEPAALLPMALLEDETGKRHRIPLTLISKANVEIEP